MKTVNPQGLPLISYKELIPFQGNLKDLDTSNHDKLLRSMEKHGFFVPAFVWLNGGKSYIMDSHQRHRVLTLNEIEFENTGFEIPYVAIEAKDEKEAKEKLLLISSQYGTITVDGLDEFTSLAELDVDELDVNFDIINTDKLWADIETNTGEEKDVGGDAPKEKRYTLSELQKELETFQQTKGLHDNGFILWLGR